jgi:hypothetical protein
VVITKKEEGRRKKEGRRKEEGRRKKEEGKLPIRHLQKLF